jgi:hypothetical protein
MEVEGLEVREKATMGVKSVGKARWSGDEGKSCASLACGGPRRFSLPPNHHMVWRTFAGTK